MVVGLATVTLHLAAAESLKDKRRVARSVTARVRARHNVAIAEVADHDARTVLTLGMVCVSTEAAHAHAMLEHAIDAIERERLDADLVDYRIELL